MTTTALINIQLAEIDRIKPSQLWPDWNTDHTVDVNEMVDPNELIEMTRAQIEFLNASESV